MLRLQLPLQLQSGMNASCHCSQKAPAAAVKNSVGWILPGVMLVLMPKCPLCLAAWISLLFGIGLSASAAKVMHVSLIICCGLFAALFTARQFLVFFKPQRSHP